MHVPDCVQGAQTGRREARSLSMNSRTSLPRSPIRAMTLISALVLRANIPIKVDFPTPEPANMPIRWPLPTVIRPSELKKRLRLLAWSREE